MRLWRAMHTYVTWYSFRLSAAIVNTVFASQSHHVIYVSYWVLTKLHASKVLLRVAVAAVPAVSSFLGVCLEIVQNYY